MRCFDKSKCLDFELLQRATVLMCGDTEKACQWMQASFKAFDGESPLVHSITETGRREVFQFIEHERHKLNC